MRVRLFLLLVLLSSVVWGQERTELGARAIGMGGAFVSISDDANGLYWNPAGISVLRKHELNIDFARLHWGIQDELLAHGGIGYVHTLKKFGAVGIRTKFFSSELFQQIHLSLSYSNILLGTRERGLFAGFSLGMIRDAYNRSKFDITQPNDPLLQKMKTSKLTPTFDLGLLYKRRNYSIGLTAKNINQPKVSATDGNDRLPLSIFSGASYEIKENILTAFSLEFKYENVENRLHIFYNVGGEWWGFGGNVGFRGGFGAGEITKKVLPQELTIGTSIRTRKSIRFDYAFLYPLSSLAGAGSSTHRLSLIFEFQPPKERYIDLFTSDMLVHPSKEIVSVGDSVTIDCWVKNIGDKSASNFYVTLFKRTPKNEWYPVDPPRKITETLEPGDSLSLSFADRPDMPGEFQFALRVNDDGKLFPELNPKKKELNYENNMGMAKVNVYRLPVGNISIEPSRVSYGRTVEFREEEPVVPVIFFGPGSSNVDRRFARTVELLAKRLNSNPDIVLEVRGYYNPLDDSLEKYNGSELAVARANATYNAIVAIAPELKDRIIVQTSGYNPSDTRAGTIYGAEIEKDQVLVNEENRRVELTVFTKTKPIIPEIYFQYNSDMVSGNALAQLPISEIREVLGRNPDIVLLVEGFTKEGEEENFLGLKRAMNVKRGIVQLLGEAYENRIVVYYNGKIRPYDGVVRIKFLAEPVLFRPVEIASGSGEETILDSAMQIRISADCMAGVRETKIWVEDENGNIIRTLADRLQNIDTLIMWDWKDAYGNRIAIGKKYFVKSLIVDNLGKSVLISSEPIEARLVERFAFTEMLFIVNFEFNRTEEESKFQLSRLETVAKKLISEAETPGDYIFRLTFLGHTDITGFGPRNRLLSDLRAKTVLAELKRYLAVLLNINDYTELDKWLREHNINLGSEGLSWLFPYMLESKNEMLGNNKFPEGRVLNRRVMLKVEKVRKRGAI